MKYKIALTALIICVFACIQLNAVVAPKVVGKIENQGKFEKKNKLTKSLKRNHYSKTRLKLFKRKKSKKINWFQKNFKKKKNKEHKIKNKWLRISLKIFLISLLVLVISLVLGLAGWSNPHTFIGSDGIVTFFFILGQIALYLGLLSLLSIIITGIILAFK